MPMSQSFLFWEGKKHEDRQTKCQEACHYFHARILVYTFTLEKKTLSVEGLGSKF